MPHLAAIEGNYNGVPSHRCCRLTGMETVFGAAKVRYAQGSPYVSELPLPVPRTALHPSPATRVSGLKGDYFDNVDLQRRARNDPCR